MIERATSIAFGGAVSVYVQILGSSSQPVVSSAFIPPKLATNRRIVLCLSPRVLCRIEFRREKGRLVVHVAGRLTEAQVPDLLEASAEAGQPPLLELDELMSADAVGLDTLMRLEERGAELIALPEFLRLKLQNHARDPKR